MHVTDAFMAMSTHLHVCSTHVRSRIPTTTATTPQHPSTDMLTQEQIQRETNEIYSKFKEELAPKIDKLMEVVSLLFDKLGGK